MQHSLRFTGLLAGLLAPLLATGAGAPERHEVGNLILDGIPLEVLTADPELPLQLDSRSAALGDWLADGTLVISTRFGNTAQLHRVRTPMGAREQFTFKAEPVSQAIAHPYDANRLLYMKDNGGDERQQIWLRNLATGAERLLTDGKSRHGTPVFAHDGKRIAFYGNARDGVSNDLYLADVDSEDAPRLLLAGGSDALHVEDWSLDDRQVAVIRYRSITDSELFLLDVNTGAQQRIELAPPIVTGRRGVRNVAPARVAVAQARFARSGRGLYFISDRGGEFLGLHHYDLYTQEITTLTPGVQRDVERFDFSQDGRFLAYTRNEAGIDRLVLHDIGLNADVLLPALPANAVITAIAFDNASRRLAVALETAQSPGDIHVLDLDTAAGAAAPSVVTLTRWTQSETGPLDATQFAAAELVQFPTWDRVDGRQRQIPAFVYRPRTPGPHPVLIDIHAGPESQHRPGWSSFRQYLVTKLGYAVVAPNVRGSSGYGRSFLSLDDGELREDAVRDIGALLVWIGVQPGFDRNRVTVAGSSYGGYMALASLAQYGDRLAGGIDNFGIGNGVNAAAIRKPLLIVQGLNDPRVPASESQQMMATVRARGSEVWYLAAKDEGQGFRKKSSSDAYRAAFVAFLRKIADR